MPEPIRFNVPWVAGTEAAAMAESLASGHTSSHGGFSRKAAEILQAETGAADVLLTTSCTSALELSAMLLDIAPGDVVIVPSFTFTTSALAFVRAGARVLFCDVDPVNLGPDAAHVAALLADPEHGPHVRAVVATHYAGLPCDITGLRAALADRPEVALVEDNAHGLFGRVGDEPLGSLGRFASLSFHETKNFTCGEGGALLVSEPGDIARAWVHYDKGTDRQAFFLGQVDKYSWRDTGSSFGLADVLAAALTSQLEEREWVQARRRAVFDGYAERLAPVAAELGLTLPHVPADCTPAYHLFHVLLPHAQERPAVMGRMKADDVHTAFHYVPLHDSDGGLRFSARPTDCPVSSDVSARLVRLPFHNLLTDDDLDRVAASLIGAARGVRDEAARR